MVIVNFESIRIFNLPLNTREKVLKRNKEALKRVKKFQKKYLWLSNTVCAAWSPASSVYGNVAYNFIPYEERQQWLTDFETVVRGSLFYKLLVFINS